MDSIPLPAAAAASRSSVTVEDESPILKRCCGCSSDRPESDFSGAQLKKKGKRVCKRCVERREWGEAKAVDDAAAAISAARPSPAGASSRSSAAAASPSAAAVCIVCGKGGAKLRTCSRCRSLYCSLTCLQQHRADAQCAAIRSLPPLTIGDEDRITEADIQLHWPRLQQRMLALLPDDPTFTVDRECLSDLTSGHFASLVRLYPPSPALPWWISASTICARFRALMHSSAAGMDSAIDRTSIAYAAAVSFHGVSMPLVEDGLVHDQFFPHLPPVLDESRLFHRLLRYLIYYYRHVDPSFIDPQLRPYIDVRSDDDGVLPAWVDDEDGCTHLIAYCTQVDESGRRTLMPISIRLVMDPERSTSCGVVYQQRGGRQVTLEDGALVSEPGLVISVWDMFTEVTACTGRTADPATSWCLAPASMFYTCTSALQMKLRDPALSQPCRDGLRSLLEARSRPDYFHLVPAMHEAFGDEWPDPTKCDPDEEAILFIATPRPGFESELAELLLLESLFDEAAKGDSHSRLLIEHIEAECGATIGEVMAEQRSRLERMMADQRDQLRIHAEAVERHDQTGRVRMKLKANGDDSIGGNDSNVHSASSSQSASASSSVAQLGESVGGLSLSSADASPNSHSAALSCSSASSSTGMLSPDRAAVALSATAATTAAAVSSAAACSWTATHRSLKSLRAPGRKKYGPILKAALRFLHSLQPVFVDRGGGSHVVFHFARGSPVTLVQPHAGGRSKDGTMAASCCTRLYQSLHSVALQQLQLGGGESAGRLESPAEALPSALPPPSASAPRAARSSDRRS